MNESTSSPEPRRRSWAFARYAVLILSIAVSVGVLYYWFYVPDNNIAWAKDYDTGRRKATETGKPMVLFFSASWCTPCRVMKRNVWADEEVEKIVNAGFVPVMINIEDPGTAGPVLRRYPVNVLPTTIITDAKGEVLERALGGVSKSVFLELLQ